MAGGPVSHQAGESHGVQDDDRLLIERVLAGDGSAFDPLVRRHQQVVFAVALRMLGDHDEAQDVAQDTFVRAYQSLGAFRREAKLSTWLVSITMNLCRNRRRWWARRRRVIAASLDDPVESGEGSLGHDVADPSPSPRAVARRQEQGDLVREALRQLRETERIVIVLRDLQGCSYEEIAAMLRCPMGTVKSRLNRARWNLRTLLNGKL
ncbi:MAG: sigma-70 family RNA polymerase sigma factor [Candidatus Omnitrophica bacterium]|nr:sigma-70 family RNA polymerase sigma factor [Candidatus Omnitrophota bacterium]